eukprot:COSAG04_NODE_27674_length_281_cov_0.560440_1_plen_70_part_01
MSFLGPRGVSKVDLGAALNAAVHGDGNDHVLESVLEHALEVLEAFASLFKQKTAYEIMSGDWSSDVCSSD